MTHSIVAIAVIHLCGVSTGWQTPVGKGVSWPHILFHRLPTIAIHSLSFWDKIHASYHQQLTPQTSTIHIIVALWTHITKLNIWSQQYNNKIWYITSNTCFEWWQLLTPVHVMLFNIQQHLRLHWFHSVTSWCYHVSCGTDCAYSGEEGGRRGGHPSWGEEGGEEQRVEEGRWSHSLGWYLCKLKCSYVSFCCNNYYWTSVLQWT